MELTPRLHLACSLRRQFLDVRNALKLRMRPENPS